MRRSGSCLPATGIPRLANPDTLVIAAADPDHPSFGCQDKAKWTYFGDAFFNVALRQAKSPKDAFVVASALVQKRELRGHFEPSNPLWQAVQTCGHCSLRVIRSGLVVTKVGDLAAALAITNKSVAKRRLASHAGPT